MGAWGGLCVFDIDRFRGEVVPALRAGEDHPLVRREIEALADRHPGSTAFQGLAGVMETFDSDLTESTLGRAFAVVEGTPSLPDVADTRSGADRWNVDSLTTLVERLITRTCLSWFGNFGLTATHPGALVPESREEDQALGELIRLLDRRATYWCHGSGGYGEGLHGWLDGEETELLKEFLPLAPDPVDATLTADLAPEVRRRAVEDRVRDARHLIIFEELVRLAVSRRCGVLWGTDLHLYYAPDEYEGTHEI